MRALQTALNTMANLEDKSAFIHYLLWDIPQKSCGFCSLSPLPIWDSETHIRTGYFKKEIVVLQNVMKM